NCNWAHSQNKDESEAMINTSHKVYIDRSLAFSEITTWWISDIRGKDGSFARSEEAQFDPSYHLWSKHALVHMQTKWHLIILSYTHAETQKSHVPVHDSYKVINNSRHLIIIFLTVTVFGNYLHHLPSEIITEP